MFNFIVKFYKRNKQSKLKHFLLRISLSIIFVAIFSRIVNYIVGPVPASVRMLVLPLLELILKHGLSYGEFVRWGDNNEYGWGYGFDIDDNKIYVYIKEVQ